MSDAKKKPSVEKDCSQRFEQASLFSDTVCAQAPEPESKAQIIDARSSAPFWSIAARLAEQTPDSGH